MNIKKRDLIYVSIAAATLFILYLGRAVLAPFFLAAAFAYILNPVVTFLNSQIKLPKTLAIVSIYLFLLAAVGGGIFLVWSRYTEESFQFTSEVRVFTEQAGKQIKNLPDFVQPMLTDGLYSIRHTGIFSPQRVSALLPNALSRGASILIFLVAAFYFLKDGHKFITNFLNLLPSDLRFESEIVLRKVNNILGNYLRAQLLLVLIMSVFTFIFLSILGIRYALVLSIFAGIAETIPFVGPVIAAGLAMIIAFATGTNHWGIDPLFLAIIVGLVYTILRQLEDLFIIPQVLGRVTKLHPLLILFVAFLGGHLFGVLGFLIAVPIVASLRVVFDHALDLLNKNQ